MAREGAALTFGIIGKTRKVFEFPTFDWDCRCKTLAKWYSQLKPTRAKLHNSNMHRRVAKWYSQLEPTWAKLQNPNMHRLLAKWCSPSQFEPSYEYKSKLVLVGRQTALWSRASFQESHSTIWIHLHIHLTIEKRIGRVWWKRNFQFVPGASCGLGPLAWSSFLLAQISFFCAVSPYCDRPKAIIFWWAWNIVVWNH